MFTGEWQTSIRTTWPTFPVDFFLYLHTNKDIFMSGLYMRPILYSFYLAAYFFIWEIVNLNLTFAVCVNVP